MTAQILAKNISKKNWKISLGKMKYEKVLQYLDELELFGIKLGLDNITALCELLGNPQDSYKIIHVAGTNGKGSVVAMCSSILIEAGYKVGMYTSPHLRSFTERIQVNGEQIGKLEMREVFDEVRKAADELKHREMQVTYFEFTTAMAFLYFKKKRCKIAVIETGLGGRLDATNVVKSKVAVITNIELEHTQYLGDTKEKIAVEKGGIIKERGFVVIGEQDRKIAKILQKISEAKKAKFTEVNDYKGKILLLGDYQKRNAGVAVAAVKGLRVKVSEKAISNGIEKTKWPGRLEVVQENPTVILDGAHNPAGLATTAAYVKGKKVILVLGISDDKDIIRMIATIVPVAKRVIITRAKYRGSDCDLLKTEVVKYDGDVSIVEDVKAAVSKAINEAEDEIVLVTGSIFVVGEAYGFYGK